MNSNCREQERDGGMEKREIPHEFTFILGIWKFTKTFQDVISIEVENALQIFVISYYIDDNG